MSSINIIQKKLQELANVHIGEEQNDEHIQKAQEHLEITLPNSFKQYLKAFGNLSFQGYEFYGLTANDDFDNAGIPNFVWASKQKWQENSLPKGYVLCYNDNEQWLYCLDTNSMKENAECDMVIWDTAQNKEEQRFHIDFLLFLEEFMDDIIEQ
jgi:hypothetical protein